MRNADSAHEAASGEANICHLPRALAAEWEKEINPAMASYGYPTFLNQISLLVVLDLLGEANTTIPSRIQTTHWAYRGMSAIEQRMRNLGLLESVPPSAFLNDTGRMASQFTEASIHDDHVPFMARGVPVMPVIPNSVRPAGASGADSGENLDMSTVRDWVKIVTAFTYEWLDMMEVMSSTIR